MKKDTEAIDLEQNKVTTNDASKQEGQQEAANNGGMWGLLGYFLPGQKQAPVKDSSIKLKDGLPDIADMDINDDDMNKMMTATDRLDMNCPKVDDDHMQIKIQFSLSGDFLNKDMITNCKLREEQVQEHFNNCIVPWEKY